MPKYTSTPYHVASTVLSDRTFDVGPIAPLADDSWNMATIAAEVSVTAAAQSSKEFHKM